MVSWLSALWTKVVVSKVHQVHDNPRTGKKYKTYGNPLAWLQDKWWKSHNPNNEARKQTETTAQQQLLLLLLLLQIKLSMRARNEADSQRPQTWRIVTVFLHYFQFNLTFNTVGLDLFLFWSLGIVIVIKAVSQTAAKKRSFVTYWLLVKILQPPPPQQLCEWSIIKNM